MVTKVPDYILIVDDEDFLSSHAVTPKYASVDFIEFLEPTVCEDA